MGDEEEEPAVVQRGDGSWLIDGRAQLDELQDQLGLSALAGDGGFHTVAGLVLYRLGRIPQMGDSVDLPGLRIEVMDMDGRRVRSEEHTSELQSLMRISYAVFCLKKKKITHKIDITI